MTAPIDSIQQDLAEQFASIRRDMAKIGQDQRDITRSVSELEPWKTMTSGMMFGAALVAASMVFTKLFL